jgi:hypothetical protein
MKMRSIRALLFGFVLLALSAAAFGQIGVAVSFGPPPLPVYDQPLCPGDGYLWTPGYWAYDYDAGDYYWVPGTWVMAPEVGFLWTPGYWGWGDGGFFFHDGFWGPQVGFYGGINYGFGYFGNGFEGGRWDGDHFFYNRAVMNVNERDIHNVYNTRVNINNENHVSYNGGNGGIEARATAEQERAAQGRHIGPVSAQTQHLQEARSNPQQRASMNHGKPEVAATARPSDFKGGAVHAREAGGVYTAPPNRGGAGAREAMPGERSGGSATYAHARDLPPVPRPTNLNTGNAKQDQKYQKQQEKMYSQQQKERDNLQKQQEKEHQQLSKQNANDAKKQQVEQRHAQQTQQLQQKHEQQRTQMTQRMSAPAAPKGGGERPK